MCGYPLMTCDSLNVIQSTQKLQQINRIPSVSNIYVLNRSRNSTRQIRLQNERYSIDTHRMFLGYKLYLPCIIYSF